jgi:lysozyme family protein
VAEFTRYYPRLLASEGGYCHWPADAGQETWRGIARAYHPGWPGWPAIDAAKAALGLASPVPAAQWPRLGRALAPDAVLATQVRAFYKAEFWDVLRLDEVRSQGVAEQLADHGVNAGPARPVRLLQYALRQLGHPEVAEDGQLGPATLRATNAAPPAALFAALVALRQAFYRYRAGQLPAPAPALLALLTRLRVRPDAGQRQFLAAWLGRVAAIPFG